MGGERRERGTNSQKGAEGSREWNRGGPLAREGGLYLNICAWVPRVPSYATADEAGMLT